MMTLKECWYKLDEEYGDIATFVAEVLVPNKIIQCYSVTLFMTFALNILKPLSANSFVFDLYNLAKTSLGIQGQLGLTLQVR
jgi:hypothetical protein